MSVMGTCAAGHDGPLGVDCAICAAERRGYRRGLADAAKLADTEAEQCGRRAERTSGVNEMIAYDCALLASELAARIRALGKEQP